MTSEEMQKVIEAFNDVLDHIERAPGLVRLTELFPDFREQIILEASRMESPDDPMWYRRALE